MEAHIPKFSLVRSVILSSLVLLGTISISGCWDDFVWPPGGGSAVLTVDAGVDQDVYEGDSITLTPIISGYNGKIVKYIWEQNSGRALSFSVWDGGPLYDSEWVQNPPYDGNGAPLSIDIPWLREGKEGPVELEVIVTDNEGNTASDTVVLTVKQHRFAVFEGVDSSRQDDNGEPFQALYRVDLDGNNLGILHSYSQSSQVTDYKISPTGEYIAFNIRQNDDFNLYIATMDGSSTKLIDKGGYLAENWQWSHEGSLMNYVSSRLAYIAAHGCDCATQTELYIATPAYDGSIAVRKVTDEVPTGRTVEDLQWASDGLSIAWSVLDPDTNKRELFSLEDRGSPTSVSEGLAPPGIFGRNFQWLPNCAGGLDLTWSTYICDPMIAYIADRNTAGKYELFIAFDYEGDTSSQISGDLIDEGDVSAFQFGASGRIAYIANRRYPGVPELFITDNGGSIDNLITRPGSGSTRGGKVKTFRWAPDGKRIGYLISQGMAPNTPIELRTALWDGSANNSVTVNLPSYSNIQEFSWSSDSNHIAYTADIDSPGTRDLFVATADGGVKKLVSNFMDDDGASVSRFAWSPGSSQIALTTDATLLTYDELFVVTPDGSVTRISDETLPMPPDQGEVTDDFQWSPEGSHIVYRTRFGSPPSGIAKLLVSTPTGDSSQTLVGEPITVGGFKLR